MIVSQESRNRCASKLLLVAKRCGSGVCIASTWVRACFLMRRCSDRRAEQSALSVENEEAVIKMSKIKKAKSEGFRTPHKIKKDRKR